jgi:hypothetical protein
MGTEQLKNLDLSLLKHCILVNGGSYIYEFPAYYFPKHRCMQPMGTKRLKNLKIFNDLPLNLQESGIISNYSR